MGKTETSIRHKLFDYIRVADAKKLKAIYNLLEDEIEQTREWWQDKLFLQELDERYTNLGNGTDKGVTLKETEDAIAKLRSRRYGK